MRRQLPAVRVEASATSERQILNAARAVFAEKGFHGSSVRDVARRAGVSIAGLYHHFPAKGALLERLIDSTMDELIAATERALRGARCPVEALTAAVAAQVRFHIVDQHGSFVGDTELRSLVSPGRERILRKRDRQQAFFDEAIEAGRAAGVFDVTDAQAAARAIVTMCTAVASWFHHGGQLKPDEVVERYCALARLMVGCAEPRHIVGALQSTNNDQEAK